MRFDEKIAMLEKEYRQRERQIDQAIDPEQEDLSWNYSLELSRIGVKNGQIFLKAGKKTVNLKRIFHAAWGCYFIQDYLQVKEESEQFLHWYHAADEVEIKIIRVTDQTFPPNTLREWCRETLNEHQVLLEYPEIKKARRTGNLDYFCCDLPTPTGVRFQINFRLFRKSECLIGNLSCQKQDWTGLGSTLEAMVVELSEINQEEVKE